MSKKVPLAPLGKASAGEEELSPSSLERASSALDWKDLPVVVTETCYGRVAGIREADGLILFLGMPYAPAPKGTLRFRPPQEKLLKQSGLSASNLFAPVIDGQLLPEDPFQALESGAAKEIPLLLGTNKDEVRLWLIYQGLLAHAPPLALLAIFPNSREVFGSRMVEVLARYRLGRLQARPGDVTLEVATDAEFWIPQVRLAEIQSRYAPTWMYRFDWPSPAKNGELGACHALELPFVFHNFHTPQTAHMVGQSPPLSLAERIQGAWIAFVRTGDPNTGDQPLWPAYDDNQRATMIFDAESTVQHDPRREVRMLYKGTPVYP